MEEFQLPIHQETLSNALSMVEAKPLHYFSNVLLNVAVVGEPGSGKSSFINNMLGKRADKPGAAQTGIQTMKARGYPHPSLPQVILWDLPGREHSALGSCTNQVDLNRFDFFIIVAYQHFQTVHADLVHEIQAMGKMFYFVRAKTDLDLEASRKQQPSGYDDEKVLQCIKEDCMMALLKESVIDPQVFLVSNLDPWSMDFPLLLKTLESDLLWLKRQAFIFSLPYFSAPVLESKKALMEGKIMLKALHLGFLGLQPVPGFSFVVAMFFFLKFRTQCYQVFGLDDTVLTVLAKVVEKPVAVLWAAMASRALLPVILWRLLDLVGAIVMVLEYCWLNCFPFIGCWVSGCSSVFTSYYMLHRCLRNVANDTQNVLSRALEDPLYTAKLYTTVPSATVLQTEIST
ncbi:PREDICTED: interferon-inducible GTPase 5-like [Gekko japonicus]|uniref:Interferon-inducible GTPase 5-like n=1 Tax=Gekko japonicus TaxID=146911 RepID=A0ABM1LFQ4_GEKJA|nr:PREDICTED: interferon-inducible GTPase 5-like [Gekko japonicus]